MTEDRMTWQDQVSAELDRRKIQALIDSGKITRQELEQAPVIELGELPINPEAFSPANIKSVMCQFRGCGQVFPTLEAFEDHVARDHLGMAPVDDESVL